MQFQTGNLEPGQFYISLVSEAQRKLPRNSPELTKTVECRRIGGPFKNEQDAKQEEKKLRSETPKLETYVWRYQRQESPVLA